MTRQTHVFSSLMVAARCLVSLVGCGSSQTETAETTPAVLGSPEWLLRGGDVNRASLMEEWKSLDEDDRLAASADLVTMQLRNAGQPNPSLAVMETLARSLEARLTEVSVAGDRDQDYVGEIVDEIWPTMQ